MGGDAHFVRSSVGDACETCEFIAIFAGSFMGHISVIELWTYGVIYLFVTRRWFTLLYHKLIRIPNRILA